MLPLSVPLRRLGVLLGILLAAAAAAAPIDFNLPAQSAAESLVALSRQAQVELLFSYDDLRAIPVEALVGQFEPEEALSRLLRNSGFTARRNLRGKFIVSRTRLPTGSLEGRILTPAGEPAVSLPVALAGTRLRTQTDSHGRFVFPTVSPGTHRLFAGGTGYQLLERSGLIIEPGRTLVLAPLQLDPASDITILDPYVVTERNDRLPIGEGVGAAPRRAAGNLDLPRTEDNALPFTLFTREQITRSGVVQLNEFFQRELLDGNASVPPEQNGESSSFISGSSNIGLRGYGADQTVVLVNGRRLPETFTENTAALGAPDVNLVPLSLVQQVEVLPVSASALYSGNAVGGVINIVLRPDVEGTEVRTTYTNVLDGFDAPQSSVSLQHGRHLLDGALKLRVNATFTRTDPAVESELGLQRARMAASAGLEPRATPNVESADGTALFGPGTASFTSVAPGSDGSGGMAAFAGREGVPNTDAFDAPGGLAASLDSRDYPYGRKQRRSVWYGSVVYDISPWLQLGFDGTYARSVIHRGHDLFRGTLLLPAASAFNPFGKEVKVALHEFASQLGEDYNQARLESYSFVAAALIRLPASWQVAFDGQYARNIARYRGLVRADEDRWQGLVNSGRYNPLRDTQAATAPAAFYDEVLVYYGTQGRFVTLGDYETFEGAVRVTNEALSLPTGSGTVNLGSDYRLSRLAPYTEQPRFADGTPAPEVVEWSGRSLERISVFGEIQAPLLPERLLPRWLRSVETDSAMRYIISAQSNETTFAPTFGLKLNLAGGIALRGSYTTSNRFPSPLMSRRLSEGSGGGAGSDPAPIFDPLRNESYVIDAKIAVNPDVRAESAVTQTAGLIWQRGKEHRFRASIDFADTTKTNEIIELGAQEILNLESSYPDRIQRTTPSPSGPNRVTTVLVGPANAARRHSQNWSIAGDYSWRDLAGGTLELRSRWVWFHRYDRQREPGGPMVDELDDPDTVSLGLLRHRLMLGAGWSNSRYGFGLDTHYFGARTLPAVERPVQGSDRIKAYWQMDAYIQSDLTHLLPARHRPDRLRLGVQLRVNNITNYEFPRYVNAPSGTGRQPYGDWRGRTFSVSFSANY